MKNYNVTVKFGKQQHTFNIEADNSTVAEMEALGEACEHFDSGSQNSSNWDRILGRLSVVRCEAA